MFSYGNVISLYLNCNKQTLDYGCKTRFKDVEEGFKRAPVYVEQPQERPREEFGKYVFNKEKL